MPGFFARLHRLRPSRPRNPLLRIALALMGVVVLAVLVAGGVLVGIGMLAFRFGQRLFSARRPAREPGVIEGDYRVVTPRAMSQGR